MKRIWQDDSKIRKSQFFSNICRPVKCALSTSQTACQNDKHPARTPAERRERSVAHSTDTKLINEWMNFGFVLDYRLVEKVKVKNRTLTPYKARTKPDNILPSLASEPWGQLKVSQRQSSLVSKSRIPPQKKGWADGFMLWTLRW